MQRKPSIINLTKADHPEATHKNIYSFASCLAITVPREITQPIKIDSF